MGETGHCVVKVEFPWEGGWKLTKDHLSELHAGAVHFLVAQVSLLRTWSFLKLD